jgi:hypothetical protein
MTPKLHPSIKDFRRKAEKCRRNRFPKNSKEKLPSSP